MNRPWPKERLGQLLRHRKEFATIDDLAVYRRPRVQLHAQGIVLRDELPGALVKTKQQQICRAGELLVAEIDAKVGGIGIVPDALGGAIVSSHYFLFQIDETKLDRRFLAAFVQTRTFLDQIEAQGSTNYAAIRPADVLGYEIPLPPIVEQRSVVARIEELAAKIHEAHTLRHEAAAEVAALVASKLGARFTRLSQTLPVHPLEELTSHIVDGPHKTPQYLPPGSPGIPFVTVKNMVSGTLSFAELNYISEDDHRVFARRCRPEYGDVLYSKDGATRGRPCFVDTELEFSYFVSVALIKPLRDRLDGRYLAHLLGSSWIRERMTVKSRGDMIPHIVLGEIRAFPVPLPPLEQQHRMVEEMDALQAQVNSLRQMQADSDAELDALLPAVLDRAFKGEL